MPFLLRCNQTRYRGALGLLQAFSGDYVSAHKNAGHAMKMEKNCIEWLIQSQQNCKVAGALANDPYFPTFYNVCQVLLNYHIAKCLIQEGQYEMSIQVIGKLHNKFERQWSRAIFYPKSLILLGQIYEKKGDREKAIASYEKLLEMWKEADADLPDLIEAKARLAILTGGN